MSIWMSRGKIQIFGEIYSDDDKQLAKVLGEAGELCPIVLSSGGGDYYTGRRMLAIIEASYGESGVEIECVGQVMSAATMLLCAKGAVVSAENGCTFLVHGASVDYFTGNLREVEQAALELASVNAGLHNILSRRMNADEVARMLETDAVFGTRRALELGLIDTVRPMPLAAKGCRLVACDRLSNFTRAPIGASATATEADVGSQQEGVGMDEKGTADKAQEQKQGEQESADERAASSLKNRLEALQSKIKNPVSRSIYRSYADGYLPPTETLVRILEAEFDTGGEDEKKNDLFDRHVAAKSPNMPKTKSGIEPLDWRNFK